LHRSVLQYNGGVQLSLRQGQVECLLESTNANVRFALKARIVANASSTIK
jgi:hypothetical protein